MATKSKLNKIRTKIDTEEDFIYCPRLGNSLEVYTSRYPEGVDNEKIAKVLMIEKEDQNGEKQPDPDEVERIFQSALRKLRASMGVDEVEEDDEY